VRVFRFVTGKLRRTYDESIEAANQMQRSDSDLYRLDPIDWGRRVAAVSMQHRPLPLRSIQRLQCTIGHHGLRWEAVALAAIEHLRERPRWRVLAVTGRSMLAAELQRGNQRHPVCEPQERELAADETAPAPNAVFDDSGNFVLYPTLLGIKVRGDTPCSPMCRRVQPEPCTSRPLMHGLQMLRE